MCIKGPSLHMLCMYIYLYVLLAFDQILSRLNIVVFGCEH